MVLEQWPKSGTPGIQMAKTGYPLPRYSQGAILLANARPDPTLAGFETGPLDSGYSSPDRLPDYGRGIRPAAHTRTRHCVIAGRGGSFLWSTWSCVRQNFNLVVQSVCDAPIINTSYQSHLLALGTTQIKLFISPSTELSF